MASREEGDGEAEEGGHSEHEIPDDDHSRRQHTTTMAARAHLDYTPLAWKACGGQLPPVSPLCLPAGAAVGNVALIEGFEATCAIVSGESNAGSCVARCSFDRCQSPFSSSVGSSSARRVQLGAEGDGNQSGTCGGSLLSGDCGVGERLYDSCLPIRPRVSLTSGITSERNDGRTHNDGEHVDGEEEEEEEKGCGATRRSARGCLLEWETTMNGSKENEEGKKKRIPVPENRKGAKNRPNDTRDSCGASQLTAVGCETCTYHPLPPSAPPTPIANAVGPTLQNMPANLHELRGAATGKRPAQRREAEKTTPASLRESFLYMSTSAYATAVLDVVAPPARVAGVLRHAASCVAAAITPATACPLFLGEGRCECGDGTGAASPPFPLPPPPPPHSVFTGASFDSPSCSPSRSSSASPAACSCEIEHLVAARGVLGSVGAVVSAAHDISTGFSGPIVSEPHSHELIPFPPREAARANHSRWRAGTLRGGGAINDGCEDGEKRGALSTAKEGLHLNDNRSTSKRRCDDGVSLSHEPLEGEEGMVQIQLLDDSHDDHQRMRSPPNEEEGRKRQRLGGRDAFLEERDSRCHRTRSQSESVTALLATSPPLSEEANPSERGSEGVLFNKLNGEVIFPKKENSGRNDASEVGKQHVVDGSGDADGGSSAEPRRDDRQKRPEQESEDVARGDVVAIALVSAEFEEFKAKVELVSKEFREFKAKLAGKVRSRLNAAVNPNTEGLPYERQKRESVPVSPPATDSSSFLRPLRSPGNQRFVASGNHGDSCDGSASTSVVSGAAFSSSLAEVTTDCDVSWCNGDVSSVPVRLSPTSPRLITKDLHELCNSLGQQHEQQQQEEEAAASRPVVDQEPPPFPVTEHSPTPATSASAVGSSLEKDREQNSPASLALPHNGGGGVAVTVDFSEKVVMGAAEAIAKSDEKICDAADNVIVTVKESSHGCTEEILITAIEEKQEDHGSKAGEGGERSVLFAAAAAAEEGGGMVCARSSEIATDESATPEMPHTPVAEIRLSGVSRDGVSPAAGYISPQSIKRIIKLQMSDVQAGPSSSLPLPEDNDDVETEPLFLGGRHSSPLRLPPSSRVNSDWVGADMQSPVCSLSLPHLSSCADSEFVSPRPLIIRADGSSDNSPSLPSASPPLTAANGDDASAEEKDECLRFLIDEGKIETTMVPAEVGEEEKVADDAYDSGNVVESGRDAAEMVQVHPEEGKKTSSASEERKNKMMMVNELPLPVAKPRTSDDDAQHGREGPPSKQRDREVIGGKGDDSAALASSSESATTTCAPALTLHLPNDTLSVVFSFLPVQDRLFTVPCVCRQWRAVVSRPESFRVADALDWTEGRILCANLLTFPAGPSSRPVRNGRITRSAADELLRRLVLSGAGHVEVLRARNCSSAGLWYLATPSSCLTGATCAPCPFIRLTTLELLDLLEPVDEPLSRLVSRCLERVSLSPAYRESNLRGDGNRHVITDKFLYALADRCPDLTHLNVRECRGVTDKGLIAVARRCRSLREIGLEGCLGKEEDAVWVTDAFSRHCPSLTRVNLSQSDLPGDALPHLFGRCRQLVHVSLAHLWSVPLACHVAKALESMGQVTELAVSCNKWFGDAQAMAIANWAKNLTSLDVAQTTVGDAGMGAIVSKLGPQLRSLRATECEITDESVAAITCCCVALRHLQLGSPKLTNLTTSLVAQGACQKLTTLRLLSRSNPSLSAPRFQYLSDLHLLSYRNPRISVLSLALCELSESCGEEAQAGGGDGGVEFSQSNGVGEPRSNECWTGAEVKECSSASFLRALATLAGNLTRLRLVGRQSWRFSDFGAEFGELVGKCDKLETIDLQYVNGIDDLDLVMWGDAAPRLQWALFQQCERLTSEGLKTFVLRCKKLRGVRAHCHPILDGNSWESFAEVQDALRGRRVLDGRRLIDSATFF